MKFTLFAAMAAVATAQIDLDDSSVDIRTRFRVFAKTFGKEYTEDEKRSAFAAFAENDAKIQDYNSRGLTYTLGHNEWSDMTADDFNAQMLGGYEDTERERDYDYTLSDPARVAAADDSKDWVALGAVTPVKNQGQCGSCWAFSTVMGIEGDLFVEQKQLTSLNQGQCGSCWAFSTVMGIEGDLFVEQKQLTSLSEQDLVSCDHNGDQGCNGGLMDNAFKWVEENGICTEADYPYTSGSGETGTCKTTCTPAVKITGFKDVPKNDESALLTAVNQQPVSVAIEADKSVFQLYKSGVLTSKDCGTTLDHGVGIVGYGTLDGTDYWKVKNSWGATWGLEGYILMERNVNMCGISQSASYPTGATASGGSSPSPAVSPAPAQGPAPSQAPAPAQPAPAQGPAPSVAPGPSSQTHYGDPKVGCLSDEKDISITGVSGDVCSPACTGVFKTKCPTDVPSGVSAEPECALQDTSSDKYCALICSPDTDITDAENDSCGPATCKPVQSVGICTYDD
eukprot:CAMPEP_0195541294 /NCGR_PEP_ID=MMETSP0794_2-20130614/50997_1 /TAXON_ID=515487 /ORGANISM="Stephanopyxis turris, Strain CCMP 815" /LENGTH=508 /DNA_ID=CAMNT_0040675389 /DNA_START=81 /DNA_END=1607 /DNA_ORIENTATION=+